jgi:hypothetical protein
MVWIVNFPDHSHLTSNPSDGVAGAAIEIGNAVR